MRGGEKTQWAVQNIKIEEKNESLSYILKFISLKFAFSPNEESRKRLKLYDETAEQSKPQTDPAKIFKRG